MSDPKTVYQRYTDNPLKFVKEYFSEANKVYDGLVNRISTNMGHMELRSDMIDKRTAYSSLSGEPMSNFYVPMIRPSVDSVVDILMDIVRSPDPFIKAEAYVPINAEPETRSILTLSANRRERYMNRAVSPRYGNIERGIEDLFMSACVFPYAVMEMNTQYCYENMLVQVIKEPELDEAGMPVGEKWVPTYDVRLRMVYPEFTTLMPWECRVDLASRNGWRYFFSWKDMSPDALQGWVKTNGGNEANVAKLIEEYLPTTPHKKVADRGSTYHATQSIQNAISNAGYRLIRSMIRMFNDQSGREEVRVLWWIEDVAEEYAILKEEVLSDYFNSASFIISGNYLLPGEASYLSDVDMSAALQDMGGESFNMGMDKSRKNVYSPRIIAKNGWNGALLEQPGALWEIDLREAGVSSVNAAYGSVYQPDDPTSLVLFGGLFEQRIQALTGSGGGVGQVAGQKRFPDRKTETLGQSNMREKGQELKLARIASRHLNHITNLIELADKKMIAERFKLNMEQLKTISPEFGELGLFDLQTYVLWSLPSAKMALQDEDKFSKIAAIVDFTMRAMPMFPQINPKGMASLMKLVYEAADIDNPDQYFDVLEENPQTNIMEGQINA